MVINQLNSVHPQILKCNQCILHQKGKLLIHMHGGWFDRFVKDLLMTVLHRMETGCLGHMQKHVDIECMQKSEHI